MLNKINKKLNWYSFLSKIPFCKKYTRKKIDKYKERLEILTTEKMLIQQNEAKKLAMQLELLKSTLDSNHKDFNKKKILIIGSFKYSNKVSLYTNSILKSLNYDNIVLHVYDYDTNKLIRIQNEAYEQNENYKEVLSVAKLENVDASLYDISIQVINPEDKIVVPSKNSSISYAYLIKNDNKELYINIYNDININFDAIITPIENFDEFLYECEILLPKFYLPLSFDLNMYERFDLTNNSQTTNIGMLADISTINKYFLELLKYNQYFQKNNVIIEFSYLQSDPNFQRDYIKNEQKIIQTLEKLQTSNIKLTKGFLYLLPPEVFEKNKKWDMFIFPEETENYMYNPYQTIRAGKCIAYLKSHTSYNNIDADGCYSFRDETDIFNILDNFIKNKNTLFLPQSIKKRQNLADKYSKTNLYKLYNSIINPGDLTIGDSNKFLDNGIQFKEKNLYVKYNYFENRKKYDSTKKIIPVPMLDAGFGSILNKYISMLTYAKDDEAYIPDWRVINLAKNRYNAFKDKKFWSFCYGKAEDENVFLKFFEPPYPKDIVPEDIYQSDIMYNKATKYSHFTEYNIEKEPNLAHRLYGLFVDENHFKEFRNKYNKTYTKYIKVKPEIQNIVNDFYSNKLQNTFNIAIHIRCAAHPDEQASTISKTQFKKHFMLYDKHIESILKQNNINISSNNWKLYIATDNDIALEYYKNKFPNNICYQKDSTRLTKQQEMEYENDKIKANSYLVGYELQQRRCTQDSLRDIRLGYEILIDMLVISKCNYFIYQSSNVPIVISYINPDLNMIYAE